MSIQGNHEPETALEFAQSHLTELRNLMLAAGDNVEMNGEQVAALLLPLQSMLDDAIATHDAANIMQLKAVQS